MADWTLNNNCLLTQSHWDFPLCYNYFKSGFETQDRTVNGTSFFICLFFFYESNTEGINFWIMFVCFTFVKNNVHVLYCIQLL